MMMAAADARVYHGEKAVSFQEPGATCSMTNWEAPFHAARREDQPGAEFPTVTPRRLTMPCAELPCGRSAQRYPKNNNTLLRQRHDNGRDRHQRCTTTRRNRADNGPLDAPFRPSHLFLPQLPLKF